MTVWPGSNVRDPSGNVAGGDVLAVAAAGDGDCDEGGEPDAPWDCGGSDPPLHPVSNAAMASRVSSGRRTAVPLPRPFHFPHQDLGGIGSSDPLPAGIGEPQRVARLESPRGFDVNRAPRDEQVKVRRHR